MQNEQHPEERIMQEEAEKRRALMDLKASWRAHEDTRKDLEKSLTYFLSL